MTDSLDRFVIGASFFFIGLCVGVAVTWVRLPPCEPYPIELQVGDAPELEGFEAVVFKGDTTLHYPPKRQPHE